MNKFLKRYLCPLLILLFVCACSELLPFIDHTPPTPEKGLPGVWQTTRLSVSKGVFEVTPAGSVHSSQFTTPPGELNISKYDELNCILKFHNNEMTILQGTSLLKGDLLKPYPYTITGDSVISGELLTSPYEGTVNYIKKMTRDSFILVREEHGKSLDSPSDATADTFCVSLRTEIFFKRLQ